MAAAVAGSGQGAEGEAPIFVVGAPRSGTTLLERLLDAHSEIAIADEIVFFDFVLALRRRVPELDTPERRQAFFELLPELDHVRFWHGVEAVLERVRDDLERAGNRASYRLFYVQMLRRYAEARGKRRFGEKTPWNIRHLGTIRDWFPDARIVHIVRDPRAQVASRRQLPRTSRDVLTNALKWRMDVDLGRSELSRWPRPENVAEVRFEDLLARPEQELARICRAIGVRFEAGMLEFHRRSDLMFRDQPWKENVLRPLGAVATDRWREELGPGQIALVECVAGRTMRALGYVPEHGAPRRQLLALRALPGELRAWRAFKRRQAAELGAPLSRELSDLATRNMYRLLLRWAFGR